MCTSAHKRWWFQTYLTISIYGLIVSGKYFNKFRHTAQKKFNKF